MEITSVHNPKIKEIKALLTKKGRREQGLFIAEGEKCVAEALLYAPGQIGTVLAAKDAAQSCEGLLAQARALGAETYIVPNAVLESLSDVKTPQGVLAVLTLPAGAVPEDASFLVALDGVQDPANVGAIIRTADAAGADGVLVSPDSADPYAPKALRASMGSVFHIGVVKEELIPALVKLREKGFTVVAAHLSGSEEAVFAKNQKTCIVIGNESSGIRENVLAVCQKRVRIPIYGKAESLNAAVAAGILLYQAAQAQRN